MSSARQSVRGPILPATLAGWVLGAFWTASAGWLVLVAGVMFGHALSLCAIGIENWRLRRDEMTADRLAATISVVNHGVVLEAILPTKQRAP